MSKFIAISGALCAFALVGATSQAITLDWDTAAWTNGSLNNSFDVDPANPGADVTVGVSGNTAQLQPGLVAPSPQTPAITTALEGGLSPVEKSLELAVNFTTQSQSVTVTINFSALYAQGVQNVSFTIFDVDSANDNANNSHFQDQLRAISALSIDGVTMIAPTITTGAANTLTGTGLSQVVTGISTANDTGVTSGAGNVTINFSTNAISSLTFTYGSGAAFADPTYQHIGLHDLSFTPVPEMNPAWFGGLSCLLAGFLVRRHHGRLRK